AGPADRRVRAGGAPHGPAKETRHRRDAGLDGRAAEAGDFGDRQGRRRAHHANAQRPDQDPRRPRGLPARSRRPLGGRMLTLHSPALDERAAARLTAFPGFLRANGFAVGGGDAVPVLQTAQRVGVLDSSVLRLSLKALLYGRIDEWQRFDELFEAWFLPANRWQRPERRDAADPARGGWPNGPAGDAAVVDDHDEELRPRQAASRQETLTSADFRTLTEREHVLDIEALMRRFARQLKHIRLRRAARSRHGRRLDLPAT